MSHGQKPRRPAFFPRMKHRGRKRRGYVYVDQVTDITFSWDSWKLAIEGCDGSTWIIRGGPRGDRGVQL